MDRLNDPRMWLWLAGAIQAGIVLANVALPSKLRVRDGIATLPLVLAPVLRMLAALLLAGCGLVFAMQWLLLSEGLERRAAQLLLTTAAASLLMGMMLVVVYALSEYFHRDGLAIPLMARFHGIANGPGFVLLGLLAWLVEGRLRGGRESKGIEVAGKACVN